LRTKGPNRQPFFVAEGSARAVSEVSAALAGLFLAVGVVGALIIVEGRGLLAFTLGITALLVAALDVPVPLSLMFSLKGSCSTPPSPFFLSGPGPSAKSSAQQGSRPWGSWSLSFSERSRLQGGVRP
jgi:hypothetical protein